MQYQVPTVIYEDDRRVIVRADVWSLEPDVVSARAALMAAYADKRVHVIDSQVAIDRLTDDQLRTFFDG